MKNPPSVEEDSIPYFNPWGQIDQTRHHLPHWQQGNVPVFVTFRLADSLPKEKLDQWSTEREAWMRLHPKPWDASTEENYHERFSRRMDEWLDEESGSCLLRERTHAIIVANALKHFDGNRYHLYSFVVMPNHVHAVFQPKAHQTLGAILKSWKGYSAHEINKCLGCKGSVWQNENFDRLIRNEHHLYKVLEYIRNNPKKAKLRPNEYILWEKTERVFSNPLPPKPSSRTGKSARRMEAFPRLQSLASRSMKSGKTM